jgi:hypothetical protein
MYIHIKQHCDVINLGWSAERDAAVFSCPCEIKNNKLVTTLMASVLVMLSWPDVAQDHARYWVLELGVLKLRVLSPDVTSCEVYVCDVS